MISIPRPPKPVFFDLPGNIWTRETNDAIAHYSLAGQSKSFKYKAYSDARVKTELKKVFVKCAYCDSRYAHVYDGDIEHFRPKLKVNEKNPKTPGYYWLANDWDNLLLSCQHCNQSRRHILKGEIRPQARGKLDQFPLSDEGKRIYHHGTTTADEEKYRLLLNPCIDHPEEHFTYDQEFAIMIPQTKMGEASLDVYVLQRPELVKTRQERLAYIRRQIGRVKNRLDDYIVTPTAQKKIEYDAEMSEMLAFTDANSEYAGMARYFVRKFLIENNLKP